MIIEEISRHDRFMYPAFQATGQSWHTGHAADDLPFPHKLALVPAASQDNILNIEQRLDPVCIRLEITEYTSFILKRIKGASLNEIPAISQTFKRRCTPLETAVLLAFQCRIVIFFLEDHPQGTGVPLGGLLPGVDIQEQRLMVIDDLNGRADDMIDLWCM
jgi:hypothetical protein